LSVNTPMLCANHGMKQNDTSTSIIFLKAALSF